MRSCEEKEQTGGDKGTITQPEQVRGSGQAGAGVRDPGVR